MSDWIAAELAECQRHDTRHTERLARRFSRLSARPVSRMPTACHGWAATLAASRLLKNPDIQAQELWSGPIHATLERLRTQAVVWRVHDPTFLHDGTPQPQAGMGTVTINTRAEDRLPPTVALTPERVT
jgi:hypothetical protein